jgi:hypothetical protein
VTPIASRRELPDVGEAMFSANEGFKAAIGIGDDGRIRV